MASNPFPKFSRRRGVADSGHHRGPVNASRDEGRPGEARPWASADGNAGRSGPASAQESLEQAETTLLDPGRGASDPDGSQALLDPGLDGIFAPSREIAVLDRGVAGLELASEEDLLPGLSPAVRRALRHALTLFALVPLTVLLATRMENVLLGDRLLSVYAVLLITTTVGVMYLGFACYRDPSMDPPLSHGTPLVSCLVAVRNEEVVIRSCVESLLQSHYPNLEIIVVDDGSDDATPKRLRELSREYPQLQTIRLPRSQGKKRALCAGALIARGDFFIFSDSDCVVSPDAISRVMAAFAAHPEIGALSGDARALNAERNVLTRMQDTWYDGQFSIWKASEAVFGAVSCVSGPMAAFRREAIFNFFPAWANDRFLGKEFRFATDRQLTGYVLGARTIGDRLKKQYADSPFVAEEEHPFRRWEVGYVKSAQVKTVVPSTLGRLVKQQVRWKKSFIRNLCFTGLFYWRRGPMPALLFYSHSLFVLMTPVMAFRHLLWQPLHGAFAITVFYLVGVLFKGSIWAVAYKIQNPRCGRWVYRPLMSLTNALIFSPLLVYSIATLRKGVWARG